MLPASIEATIERIKASQALITSIHPQTRPKSRSELYFEQRSRLIARWERSIPEEYAGKHLENLDVDERNRAAVAKLQALVVKLDELFSGGINVVLHGAVGTGKTCLAWCFGRAVVRAPELGKHAGPDGRWARFGEDGPAPVNQVHVTPWIELLEAEKKDWHCTPRTFPLERAAAVPLLVLDDISTEETLDAGDQGRLRRVVDARYLARRPTLVTTNYDLMTEKNCPLDPRIVDRLLQSDRCIVRAMSGATRRRRA